MATTQGASTTIGRGLGLLRYPMWGGIAALLLAPLVAMRMGAEGVNWTAFDFIFAGVVLGGAGLLAEAVGLYTRTWPARLIGLGLIGLGVVGVWAMAVSGAL